MSRDVVFDKSASWYESDSAPFEPTEEQLVVKSDDDVVKIFSDSVKLVRNRHLSVKLCGYEVCKEEEKNM